MENRLYRRRKDKVFGGIASGLGQYLDIDPIIVRIIFVLITIFHGVGLLVYVIMWIVMPEEPIENLYQTMNEPIVDDKTSGDSTAKDFSDFHAKFNELSTSSSNSRTIIGALLIGIGFIFLLERFIPTFDFELILALGLIILGFGLTFNFFKK
ncbi:MAG: PspC domain-containing protein [Ignavibacteriae bacterium]|nr:PspC domain-containing protein [Ignavibacteriota bacterium]